MLRISSVASLVKCTNMHLPEQVHHMHVRTLASALNEYYITTGQECKDVENIQEFSESFS